RTPRTRRVYTSGGQHVPGRHLSDVLVSYDAFHGIFIGFVADMTGPFLCQPRSVQMVKEKGHEMYRLIGMIVIIVPQHMVRRLFEKTREVFQRLAASSH